MDDSTSTELRLVPVSHSMYADMGYERDILDEFEAAASAPRIPTVEVSLGLVVEDRASGFVGDVVRWNHEAVTLRDRKQYLRHFTWKPGGFLLEGRPVTLADPARHPIGHVDSVHQLRLDRR